MDDKTLDATARANGATHKDAKARNRYYRYSRRMQQCEKCDGDPAKDWVWRYFGSKLPVTAVKLGDEDPLRDDEFNSWHDDPGYF